MKLTLTVTLALLLAASAAEANRSLKTMPAPKLSIIKKLRRFVPKVVKTHTQLPQGGELKKAELYFYDAQAGALLRQAVKVEKTLPDGAKVTAFRRFRSKAKRVSSETVDKTLEAKTLRGALKNMVLAGWGMDAAATTTVAKNGVKTKRAVVRTADETLRSIVVESVDGREIANRSKLHREGKMSWSESKAYRRRFHERMAEIKALRRQRAAAK